MRKRCVYYIRRQAGEREEAAPRAAAGIPAHIPEYVSIWKKPAARTFGPRAFCAGFRIVLAVIFSISNWSHLLPVLQGRYSLRFFENKEKIVFRFKSYGPCYDGHRKI